MVWIVSNKPELTNDGNSQDFREWSEREQGIVIAISAATALFAFFKILRKSSNEQTQERETIRLRLARGLLLALDFEVGSDILKTILVPAVNELSILAVVVGIRIVLSWSLSKEIDRHNVNLVESSNQQIAERKKENPK